MSCIVLNYIRANGNICTMKCRFTSLSTPTSCSSVLADPNSVASEGRIVTPPSAEIPLIPRINSKPSGLKHTWRCHVQHLVHARHRNRSDSSDEADNLWPNDSADYTGNTATLTLHPLASLMHQHQLSLH